MLRGWAPESLLASYESERRPAAEHNVVRSADGDGSRRQAADEVHVDLGGRIRHLWVAPGVSTLDLVHDGLTLLTAAAPGSHRSVAEAGAVPPVSVVPLDARTARSLGLGTHGAVLLRPDALPVAAWSTPAGSDQVARAIREFLRGPRQQSTLPADSAA